MRNSWSRSEALGTVVALWYVLVVILILTLEGCARGAPRDPARDSEPAPTLFERYLREDAAAIEVRAVCGEGYYSGSGVLIGGDLALTALHVALPEKCSVVDVLIVVGTRYVGTAVIEARWSTQDVARLRLSPRPRAPAPIPRRSTPVVGETLCAATASPRREHHCGFFEQGALSIGGGYRRRWDAFVRFGNSGSAIYDDRGRLVGIVTNGRFDERGEPVGVGWFAPVTAEMLR